MSELIDTFFNLAVMRQYLPLVLQGMWVTIVLGVTVVASGLALGFVLAVLRSLRIRLLDLLIVLFADVFRAVPALVILIIIYFALPSIGIRLSGPVSAWLGLVVLPQALRLTVAPLTNRAIVITKNTALASVLAVGEILYQAQAGYSFSYNPSPLTLGAIAYLVLFVPLIWFGRWVEGRFAWKR